MYLTPGGWKIPRPTSVELPGSAEATDISECVHSNPRFSDWDDYGTESFKAFPEWRPVTVWFKDLRLGGWGAAAPFTPRSLSGFAVLVVQAPGFSAQPPSGLFDGMIAPIDPFAIRGAAWNPSEDNASRAYQYRELLPALIQGWRAAWGQGDFPFLIVQLPNYGRKENHPPTAVGQNYGRRNSWHSVQLTPDLS
jgi:hypothetical protein